MISPKSLNWSRAGRHFYETENEISAGFGLVGNAENKIGGPNVKKHCGVCTKKLHEISYFFYQNFWIFSDQLCLALL